VRKRLLIAAGLLLAELVGLIVWRASWPREPLFEGRRLSSWLNHHVASSSAKPPYGSPGWQKADEALRHIGTNAIPTLLRMIRAKDPPPLVLKLIEFQRYRWTRINYRYAYTRHEEAEYAFRMLGTNGASAIQELIKIYEEATSPASKICAAQALGSIGPAARPAVPVLLRNFTDTNAKVRSSAVSSIISIGGEPNLLVPAFTMALNDPDVGVRWNALSGLSRFGGKARPAVSEILKMRNDTGLVGSSPIQEQVESTLWQIAPEKVGKPFVVEQVTPMISNGVTTEALKLMFLGNRKTLIAAGKAIPAVAQYWNSDPRPRLTLYRGIDGQDQNDHPLGAFEVMDLSPDNCNVSTLCIIAEGQITLCARDNTRHLFLEIRRAEKEAVK
jgi:hypothetical protein